MHETKCLKKAFIIQRIAGMCPLSFNNGLPQIDYYILPYSITVISLVCYMTLHLLMNPPSHYALDWVTLFSVFIQNIVLCMNIVSSYICLAFNKNSLRSAFMYFLDSDVYFAKFGKKPRYEISLFYDLMLLLLGSVLFFCYYPLRWKSFPSLAQLVQVHYLMLSVFISVQPFIRLSCIMNNRFRMLNSTLVELSSIQFCQSDVVELFLNLHDVLCRASEDVNKCFSFQLLFSIFLGFVNFTVGAYMTITSMGNSFLLITVFRTFVQWFNILRMILLANVCETTAEESKQLHILLHKRLLEEDIRKIQNMGKVETFLLMKRKVEFKGYGFLIIDHTLLLSMLGAGTTYLVVLLQAGSNAINSPPPINLNATAKLIT